MISRVRSRIVRLFADRGFAEILSGSMYAVAARMGGAGVGLVATMIVARVYGPEITGIMAVINSLLIMTTVVAVLGTGTSILRLIPEHRTRYSTTSAFRLYRKTQYLVAALSVLIATLLFFSSDLLAARFFGKAHLAFFFALAAPVVVVKSLMLLNTQAVRGLFLIRTFAFMQMLPSLATLVFLVVATLLLENRYIPIYAQLSGMAVTALVGMWIMDTTFKRKMRPGDIAHAMRAKEIISLSVPMFISAAMYFTIGQTAIIVLGMFRSEAEVGYYAVAVSLARLTSFLLAAINSIAAPKFSELFHARQTDEVLRVAKKSTKLIFWMATPVLLGLIFLGWPALSLLFGSEFTRAYLPMVFLAVGQFVSSSAGSTGIFLNMTGHEKVFQRIMLAAAGLNIALSVALIPRFGIEGAAIAKMMTTICWNAGTVLYIKWKFGRAIGYLPGIGRPRVGAQGWIEP
jgi:O-antigen/teichoic acid export membrane protein